MVDLQIYRPRHCCRCDDCQAHPKGVAALDHQAINRVLAKVDERRRRLLVGLLASRHGHGGIVKLAEITGLSRTTIRRGMRELQQGIGLGQQRVRRPGGGRKHLEKKGPRW